MKKYIPNILFIISLLAVAYLYDYQHIILKRPQSIHKWRQSDCASIALNYYYQGMDFFNPETHNLTSNGGTSGKGCTSEIPVLYYFVAILYHLFGYHEFIYRLLNTLIFLSGIFFLFKLFKIFLNDVFLSIVLSLLFFTSPVLVYYGNNFLTNSSALSFSIIGWYFFASYFFLEKLKYLIISLSIFLIAVTLKITALFSVFALITIFIVEIAGYQQFGFNGKLFKHPVWFILLSFLIFLLSGTWIIYAHSYNFTHDCTYFSTTIFPIWNYNKAEIFEIIKSIYSNWNDQYFHPSVYFFILICLAFVFRYKNYNFRLLTYCIIIVFIEVVVYFILQFWTFINHDYYTIDIYILLIIIVLSAFYIFRIKFQKIFESPISKALFSIFLILNIYYAMIQVDNRYYGELNDYSKNKDIYTITPYLRQIGINCSDTVISIPDGSNSSLYLMDQKGWTEYVDARFNRGMRIYYNKDSAGIQQSIDRGAKYLIINNIQELYFKPYLKIYCNYLKGRYNDVLIFDLKNKEKNFNLKSRSIISKYLCNTETLTNDSNYFINETDSTLFEFGKLQTKEEAHSGQYSIKVGGDSQFGLTIKIKDVKVGESFVISVWRKPVSVEQGYLIASCMPVQYYNADSKVIEKSNGWERIEKEFFINSEISGQELGIYVYNQQKEFVYFDDLEIIRYKSIFND